MKLPKLLQRKRKIPADAASVPMVMPTQSSKHPLSAVLPQQSPQGHQPSAAVPQTPAMTHLAPPIPPMQPARPELIKHRDAEDVIKVEHLNVFYNQGKDNEMHALKDINLSIKQGEYVIMFGPSGCGKTTLLFSIAGLQTATNGSVTINNLDISKEKKDSPKMTHLHRNIISIIFQSFHLIPSLTVAKNIALPAVFTNTPRPERVKRVKALLTRFGIVPQANKLPSQLSGGQKQRVAISRALMNDAKIILADEPVGNLDSKSADTLLGILRDLNEKEGRTIVLVTHDARHLSFADRIFHMQDGVVVREEVNHNKTHELIEKKEVPKDSVVVESKEKVHEALLVESHAQSNKLAGQVALLKKSLAEQAQTIAAQREKIEDSEAKKADDTIKIKTPEKQKEAHDAHNPHLTEAQSTELALLAKSYTDIATLGESKSFSSFKVSQFVQDILIDMSNVQVKVIEREVAKVLGARSKANYTQMRDALDAPLYEGGAGLDSRVARKITVETQKIHREVLYLAEQDRASHLATGEEALRLAHLLMLKHHVRHAKRFEAKLSEIVVLRLNHKIDGLMVLKLLDEPLAKGGVGLDRRNAKKIARDLEAIMLLKYQSNT